MLLVTTPTAGVALELTAREKAYVDEHPSVSLCVDPDWAPFERIDEQGEHVGIAADLLKLVSERTGLRFELLRTKTWDESLEASQNGRCKALSFLNATPKRESWLLFTVPLLNDPNVFITREEHPYIADPAGLSGETIVLPKGTSMEELVRREYPNLTVITTETENEAVTLVSERKANLTMRSLIVAASTIRNEGLFNLKIAGQMPEHANQLRIGVVHSEPLLRNILDKGVRTITPQERERIINQHVAIKVQMGVDYSLILKAVAVFIVLLAIGLYWNMRLRRFNAEIKRVSQSDQLTGLHNRVKIDAQLPVEIERARRYGRPLSLLMFDVDHFKLVNDEMGHPMGDKVLVAIAQAAMQNTRNHDILGRWGGEEFLVLCPETDIGQAMVVAERIRKGVEEAVFPSSRRHSISVGVSTLSPEDTVETLLKRADMALYKSKNNGRNKVSALPEHSVDTAIS